MTELQASFHYARRLSLPMLIVGVVWSSIVKPGIAENSQAIENISVREVTPPTAISADEPLTESFSLRQSVDYLDKAALDWQQRMRCVTCHTNGLFLAARGEVAPMSRSNTQVREFTRHYLKRYAIDNEPPRGDRGAIQGIVAATALLAISDIKTTGQLDPVTVRAFDYVWDQQSEQGCWEEWLKCNWPPFEVDDHFGVTLVAYAAGMTPKEYAETPSVQKGLRKLREYLHKNPPRNMHQMAMLLLASTTCKDILEPKQRQEAVTKLFSLQKPDGGWNLVELGGWPRSDGKEQDTTSSDGYATGFVTYVLRKSGVTAQDPRIQKALGWLKANQRASGRWYTRSPRRDGKHYISNAGTAYAVMALASCDESLSHATDEED